MGDPNAPSIWLILALGMLLMGSFIFVLWAVNRLAGRTKSAAEEGEEHAPAIVSRPIREATPQVRPSLLAHIMSLILGQAGPVEPPATPLPDQAQEPGQLIAKPGNGVNDRLPGNALPEEVREVMRFWAMVDVAERLIKTGKLGQAEAIEVVFNCKRSGRPDSPYARARAAIATRSEAQYRERQAQLIELQTAAAQDD